MKGKNMIVLLVTILVMVSLVSIAAYSYFAASMDYNTNVAIVNTKTPAGIASFTTYAGTANLINVQASSMTEAASKSSAQVAGSANTTLTVNLVSQDGSQVKCTYDLYYTFLSGSTTYVQTKSTNKEFTYTAVAEVTGGNSGTDITNTKGATTNVTTETQIENNTSTSTARKIGSNTIWNTSSTATSVKYTITLKFYNLTEKQTQTNASYNTKFYVTNVQC